MCIKVGKWNKSLTAFLSFHCGTFFVQVPRFLDPYLDEPWYECEQNCETALVSCKKGKIWSMINHYLDKTSPSMKTGLVRLLFRTSFVEQHKRLTFSLYLRHFLLMYVLYRQLCLLNSIVWKYVSHAEEGTLTGRFTFYN